jgi:hypothetical protein
MDGVRAGAGSGAKASDRGPEHDAPTNAFRIARFRHGQRQRVHERDGQNVLQPSFTLAGKARDGAKVKKTYHPPATALVHEQSEVCFCPFGPWPI